ncbi:MAG: cupin domain-containing protein [Devosia nanyangense]|uniref:Cupin domain-containing protein n=1 Tax=Devosia nanyangense TaxID=1228055 RepID=A0A933L0B2_9HYPH|nr:cupin domain-containing protein [Devosia nanyangense]
MKQCKVIRGGGAFHGKQGLDYFAGVSAESADSEAICMHILVMPPGAEARPHYHAAHETAIYMLEGSTSFRHGPNLEFLDTVEEGDFVYIPAGVPHQPFNPTAKIARALIARTDPNEQESVVLI